MLYFLVSSHILNVILEAFSIERTSNKFHCLISYLYDNIEDNLSDVDNEMSGGLKRKNSSDTEVVNEATGVAADNNNIKQKTVEKESSPNKRMKVCFSDFFL